MDDIFWIERSYKWKCLEMNLTSSPPPPNIFVSTQFVEWISVDV